MSETIDELTITYMEDGVEKVKQLEKEVLTKGAWSTIMYKYQNWDPKAETYKPPCYAIRRYQKRNGEYQLKSKFNISSDDQARRVIDILSQWVGEG
jgi:hypothetical protein